MGGNKLLNGENILVFVILIISGLGFIRAFSFPGLSYAFPQFTAGTTFIICLILLLRNFLPPSIRNIINMVEVDTNKNETIEGSQKGNSSNLIVTSVLIIAYVIIGYLIGFLWASPVFTFAYTSWFRLRWYIIVIATVMTFVLAYVFMVMLYLPIDEGVIKIVL